MLRPLVHSYVFRSSERLDCCRPESSDVRGLGLRNHYFWFFGGSAAGAKMLICAAREGLPDVPTVRHKADSSYLGLHSTLYSTCTWFLGLPGSTNLCYQTMATRIYYRIESVRRKPLSRWFDLYFRTSQTP